MTTLSLRTRTLIKSKYFYYIPSLNTYFLLFFFFFCPFFSFEVLVCYITLRKDQVLYFSNIIKLCIGNSCADNGKLSWHGVIMAS